MAKKKSGAKLEKPDLGIQMEHLSKNLEVFTSKVEQFCGVVDMVNRRVKGVEDFLGRVTFPAQALSDLTGELRALRHLWDKEGKYAFMDRPQTEKVGDASKP